MWFVVECSSFATALTFRFSIGLQSFGLYDLLVLTETQHASPGWSNRHSKVIQSPTSLYLHVQAIVMLTTCGSGFSPFCWEQTDSYPFWLNIQLGYFSLLVLSKETFTFTISQNNSYLTIIQRILVLWRQVCFNKDTFFFRFVVVLKHSKITPPTVCDDRLIRLTSEYNNDSCWCFFLSWWPMWYFCFEVLLSTSQVQTAVKRTEPFADIPDSNVRNWATVWNMKSFWYYLSLVDKFVG